jgi:hypothetical protein
MKKYLAVSVALGLCSLCACSSTDISSARGLHETGNYSGAAAEIMAIHPQGEDGLATSNRAEDNIWLLLEKGKMLLDAGRFAESNEAFYEANRILETLDEEAVVSLGAVRSGAASLLIDDRQSDYVGASYDRIMLPVYVSLNHLMLGEFDAAAVAARQQATWQRLAEQARQEEITKIEEMDEQAADEGLGIDHESAMSYFMEKFDTRNNKNDEDQSPEATTRTIAGEVDSWATPAYADYSIPVGRYIGALALNASGNQGESIEMKNAVVGMVPSCSAAGAGLGAPRTAYVIFENGLAPKRVDRSVSFLYMYKGKVKDENGVEREVLVPSYVKLPFVGLERVERRATSLEVTAGDRTVVANSFHSMEGIVGLEFKDALPATIARILLRAAIHEVGQIAANQEFGAWSIVGGALLKSLVSPDLRGWESLPAEFSLAVVPVPEDGSLQLGLSTEAGPGASAAISVPVGPPVLVYVRSTTPESIVAHVAPLETVAP